MPSGPDNADQETPTSDALAYVDTPLDVMLAYYFRAEGAAAQCLARRGDAEAAKWLQRRDEDDRAAWAQLARQSELTMGQVVDRVMKLREGHWEVEEQIEAGTRTQDARDKGTHPNLGTHRGRSHVLKPDQCDRLKSGILICRALNSRTGCPSPCPDGMAHVCNKMTRPNRACGLSNHNYETCRARPGGRAGKKTPQKGR